RESFPLLIGQKDSRPLFCPGQTSRGCGRSSPSVPPEPSLAEQQAQRPRPGATPTHATTEGRGPPQRPGSVGEFVTSIRPVCSPEQEWPGLTAPPVPARPVGRSVERPGGGTVRTRERTRGKSGRRRRSRTGRRPRR